MAQDKPYRRLPLRDLLTDAEKRSRDVADFILATWTTKVADLRELSRPVRRKSHYPTLLALQNSLQKVLETTAELEDVLGYLQRQLEEVRDHAKRERFNRN